MCLEFYLRQTLHLHITIILKQSNWMEYFYENRDFIQLYECILKRLPKIYHSVNLLDFLIAHMLYPS